MNEQNQGSGLLGALGNIGYSGTVNLDVSPNVWAALIFIAAAALAAIAYAKR